MGGGVSWVDIAYPNWRRNRIGFTTASLPQKWAGIAPYSDHPLHIDISVYSPTEVQWALTPLGCGTDGLKDQWVVGTTVPMGCMVSMNALPMGCMTDGLNGHSSTHRIEAQMLIILPGVFRSSYLWLISEPQSRRLFLVCTIRTVNNADTEWRVIFINDLSCSGTRVT